MFKIFTKNKYERGMTIVELLVVIGIFTIISVIIIFDYGKFRSTSSLQNLADDVALSVRKAQSFAIGVRGAGSGGFSPGYGVHFSIENIDPSELTTYSGSNRSFVLFANIDNDISYDNNGSCGITSLIEGNECIEELKVMSTDRISSIIYSQGGSDYEIREGDVIDIFFLRPNPEPTFCYKTESSSTCDVENISYVKIEIKNDANPDYIKTVTIYNNGQISVT
jgi:prepilin-type N-terminal cleavage/methylation domain-containing protein